MCILRTWEDGKVFYIIDDSIKDTADISLIKSVIRELGSIASCLTFTEMSDPETVPRYLRLTLANNTTGVGCWSYLGQQGGEQLINLSSPDCMQEKEVTVSILHSLGLYLELDNLSDSLTASQKIALNSLYQCPVINSNILTQFMREEKERVDRRLKRLEEMYEDLRMEVRKPPFVYQCGSYHDEWCSKDSTVTYSSLLHSSMSKVEQGLNITSGIFTAGLSGTWRVSFSMRSALGSGQSNTAHLYLNNRPVSGSRFRDTVNGGNLQSMGSRTLLLQLEAGDQISLRVGRLGWCFADIIFCVELAESRGSDWQ